MIPVNLDTIGCDSYAISGHKWLGGPHETGVLYIRHAKLDAVATTSVGAHSGELAHLPGKLALGDGAIRHEYGTRNAGLVAGLAQAVRTRKPAGGNAEAAHRTACIMHLANIAIRMGRKIRFDPVQEMVIGDEEANRLAYQPMRAPWHL